MRGCPVRLVLSLGALLLPPTLGAKAKPEELLQLTDDTLEAALASHPLMLVNACADTRASRPPVLCVQATRTGGSGRLGPAGGLLNVRCTRTSLGRAARTAYRVVHHPR